MSFKDTCAIVVCAALLLVANFAYPVEKGAIDVVLVMDSSGSMKKTDPKSMRIPAAKMFISLLKENDRAGVISFSGQGNTIINLTPVGSQANKDKLLSAAEKITSDGRYTNLHDALRKGIEVVSGDKATDRKKIVVLMSDGMMDVGDPLEDMKLVDMIRDNLSGELEESEIKVYTIAFTAQSDRELLEKISKRSGGFYNLALSDNELHIIFTSIFESLKSPEMLPMSQNGFKIDKTVEEVTIVATKGSGDTKIMLNSPDGHSYTHESKGERIEWFVSNSFDMITVKYPVEGRWEILFSTGENNKAYIITDLKLQTNFDKLYSTYGEPMDVQVWLEKEGSILSEQDIIDKIALNMELTDPNGRIVNLKPFYKGDGTYIRRIAPFAPGNYKLKIIAKGKTFEREKDFLFNVAGVQESKEDLKHELEKKKKVEEQIEHKPLQEEKAEEEKAEEEISWVKIVLQFLAINLILGIGIFAYIKVKKSKKGSLIKLVREHNKAPEPEQKTEVKADTTLDNTEQEEDKNSASQDTEDALKEQPAAQEPAPPEQKPQKEPEPEPAESIENQGAEVPLDDGQEESDEQDSSQEETAPEQETLEEPEPAELSEKQGTEVQLDDAQEELNEQEIALDDQDTGTEEQGELPEAAEQKTEASNEEPVIASQVEAEPEKTEASLAEPVQNSDEKQDKSEEAVLNQEDLDALLEGETGIEADTGVQQLAEDMLKSPPPSEPVEDIIDQAELDALLASAQDGDEVGDAAPEEKQATTEDTKTEENIDDMWAEAFEEAEGQKKEEQTAEPVAPAQEKVEEAQDTAADEKTEENVDDMWAEAFKEAEGQKEEEQTAEPVAPAQEKVEEAQDTAADEKAEENIDDMWAEAFKEAEENNGENQEAQAVNKKKTTGEEPVDG